MKEYKWDKATITPNEIMLGLVDEYGPEQPITVEMEDRNAQIPYKSAMATFECHRCGSTFNMTPSMALNQFYSLGYVCLKCGKLSDEDLRAKKKEDMNTKAIEVLKERGIDPFSKDEDELKAEAEQKEDERVALSAEDYSDAFDELNNESTEDYSEYMASEEDEKSPISSSLSVTEEEENSLLDETPEPEMTDEEIEKVLTPEEIQAEKDAGFAEGQAKAKAEAEEELNKLRAERETLEAEKKALAEEAARREEEARIAASKKAQEEAARIRDEIRAEMEAKMKAEIEAEREKANAEIEAAKKAQEKAEQYAAEANLRASEAKEAMEAIQNDSEELVFVEPDEETTEVDDQSEIFEDDSLSVEDDDDDVTGFGPMSEEEQPTVEYDQVVGLEGYSQEEFDNLVKDKLKSVQEKFKYSPWLGSSFDTDDDGHIIAQCRQCGQTVKLNSFDDIDKVVVVGHNFCKKHGLDPNKINNSENSAPIMHACNCCIESVIQNGYNEYHRNTIQNIAKESHFNIVDANKHWFIPEVNEVFTIECNGIKKEGVTFADLATKYNGVDLREDPEFKVAKKEETVIKAKPAETKPEENASHVLHAKPFEEATDDETPKGNPIFKKSAETTHQEQMAKKYSKGPFVENASDTSSVLEEERAVENENIVKNTIFKAGQKLVLKNKNIAKINGNLNPFERERGLKEQFQETEMAKFISDLSGESEVKCNLILNAKTYELPVIDFESGLRVICADLSESSMPNIPFGELGNPKYLPFTFYNQTATEGEDRTFKKRPKEFNWVILFSDAVEQRRDATFWALMKYVNPGKLAYNGQRIQLEGNFDFEYTTYDQFLRDFDVRCSPCPGGKPRTGQLGILAHWRSSAKSTARDVIKFQQFVNGMGNVATLNNLEEENSEYMVASIKYIERYNKESNRVIYTITEYVEHLNCLIADGLAQCVRALLKEYMMNPNYAHIRNVEPYVIVECDPNNFTSPSIRNYVSRGTLVPMNDTMRQIIGGSSFRPGKGVEQYLRYSYVRRPEYRTKDSDSLRHDIRMFSAGTLIRTMTDEIKRAGIQNTIKDPDVKNRFIANMGYVKARQAEIKEMFMDQTVITSLLYDSKTSLLRKHIEADGNMFQKTQMVTDSTTGIGINNILTNPNLLYRYQRIMENGTNEAKQYMNNLMYQSNPVAAAQMQMMSGFGMQNPNFPQMGMMFNQQMGN